MSDLSLTVQVTLSQITCLLEVTGSNPDLPFFTVTSLQVKTEKVKSDFLIIDHSFTFVYFDLASDCFSEFISQAE